MWLVNNNMGKISDDPKRDKLIYFPDSTAATNPAPAAADPVVAGAVVLPTVNGTWANFTDDNATQATAEQNQQDAQADAGQIMVEFQGVAGAIPWFST
ncbi:MAG TPA: hypothetical protein VK465_01460 [Fibrobacteria bacterium]|nr:hypothetical protein [Fibrobacteria bacterium]